MTEKSGAEDSRIQGIRAFAKDGHCLCPALVIEAAAGLAALATAVIVIDL